MKLHEFSTTHAAIEFSHKEFNLLCGTISHLLIPTFVGQNYSITTSTGWQQKQAEALSEALRHALGNAGNNHVTYIFSKDELQFLERALGDAVREIGWEFSILTGYTLDDADRMQQEIAALLAKHAEGVEPGAS